MAREDPLVIARRVPIGRTLAAAPSLLASALLVLALPAAAPAAPVVVERDAQRDLALTVYASDLALVREVREARLPAGATAVQFRDVPSAIDPTSVVLRALPDPKALTVLEQRYAFDLLTPETLLARFVGREIEVWLDGELVRARLLGVAGGPVYEIDGKVYVDPDVAPVLPSVPDDLVARPTLFWRVRSPEAQTQRLEVSYLTSGLSWQAVYTLVLDRESTRGDLTGWASVTNRSGIAYRDAALALVAGELNRARPPAMPFAARARETAATADVALPAPQAFSEYHLYPIDGRTTLEQNETTQLPLVDAPGVAVTRQLIYQGDVGLWQPRPVPGGPDDGFREGPVLAVLEFRNAQAGGLGRPLPAGTVRILAPDASGVLRLAGEDAIGHVARDETVRLRVGTVFDVRAARRQVAWQRVDDRTNEVEWEIRLRNRSDRAETVRVVESVPGDWQVVRSSRPGQRVDANTLRFDVPVPAGGEVLLSYRVRSRW